MARYVIFHNPISGEGLAARLVAELTTELQAHGHQVDELCTGSKEEATAAARDLDPGYEALISVGGDGTHNSIVNGLVDRPVPLLPVPAGTENVLSKGVDVPADPRVIREILEGHRVRSVDVAMANDHAFLVMSGVGLDAAVTAEVHQKRNGPIRRMNYYWPTVKHWLRCRRPHLEVEVDGERVASEAPFLIVGNMRMYADRLHVCARAEPDDGLLDVCVFESPGRLRLVRYFLAARRGRHLEMPDVTYAQGRRIVIRPAEADVPFQVDGDLAGHGVVEYTVRPKALKMFVRTYM